MMFTKVWALDAAERAIKTFAQTALSLVTVSGLDLLNVDWQAALTASGIAAGLSLLTSIASSNAVPGASLAVAAVPAGDVKADAVVVFTSDDPDDTDDVVFTDDESADIVVI